MAKLLLIGSRQNKSDKYDTGGVTILFELLISELKYKNIKFNVIDTLKANYSNLFFMYISLVWKLFTKIPKHDHIALHATSNTFIVLGPFIIILSKLFSKPVSIRKFAGNFENIYKESNFFKKILIRFVLKNSNYLFFETKYLVAYFKTFNANTFWFPNVRSSSIQKNSSRKFRKHFVYIGSIIEEKGIDDLCLAISELNQDIVCDLYGPIVHSNKKYSNEYFKSIGISYKGSLESTEVQNILNQYDVLVLPSHREGYPGVIIEAFALGIPVVTTKLIGIMEMCTDGKNAILIDAKQPKQLLKVMNNLDDLVYEKLHIGAIEAFKNFNSTLQTNLYLDRIECNIKDLKDD